MPLAHRESLSIPVHILLQFPALSTLFPEDYRPSTRAGLVHLEEVLSP